MSNFMGRRALGITILVLLLLAAILLLAPAVHADEWDKSSLSAVGQCLPGGIPRVTVTNGGQDMQGPVDYGWVAGVKSGTLQLKAGESIALDSPALPNVKIEFWVNQRPGHPGEGVVWMRMACSPNAVKLTTLTNSAVVAPFLTATGQCLAGGVLRVTVTNTGDAMPQSVRYSFLYAGPIAPQDGTLQLGAGASTVLDSHGVPGTKIEFVTYQSDWSEVKVTNACGPNAVELTELTASGACVRTPYCYIINARWSWVSFDMALCKRLQRPIYYKMVCQ